MTILRETCRILLSQRLLLHDFANYIPPPYSRASWLVTSHQCAYGPGKVYRNGPSAVSLSIPSSRGPLYRSRCFYGRFETDFAAKEMFGRNAYQVDLLDFPFTEPSAEMDIYWGLKNETDHRITKRLRILRNSGLWHRWIRRHVNCGIDQRNIADLHLVWA